jgi:hypothetical protein
VWVLGTEVAHNIKVTGTTGYTIIGNKGCIFDPHVGNNIKVSDSHNVLICQESVDNNIKVTRNDGRITVRDSSAAHANILVRNNYKFNPNSHDVIHHKRPGRIRVLDCAAKEHIFVKHNHGRGLYARGNTPAVNS